MGQGRNQKFISGEGLSRPFYPFPPFSFPLSYSQEATLSATNVVLFLLNKI